MTQAFLMIMVAVACAAAIWVVNKAADVAIRWERKLFEREIQEIRDKAMEAEILKSDELRQVAKAITEQLFTTVVWSKEAVEYFIYNELLARLVNGDEANSGAGKGE